MRPLASNIGDTCDDMLGQFVLDVEVPLLNIGPTSLGIDGIETEREGLDGSSCSTPDARIVRYIRLGWIQHQRRSGLQCFDTFFVAVSVVEEDSVTSAHGPIAIAPGVPGKTKPRGRVEQMSVYATGRLTGSSALHHTVERT